MNNLLLIVALLFSGCGPLVQLEIKDPRIGDGIDVEVIPYLYAFERAWGRSIYDLPITLIETIPDGHSGECRTYASAGVREVLLNARRWSRRGDTFRTVLVFHELGHCVLDRRHNEYLRMNGLTESLMYPDLGPTIAAWSDDEQYYTDELFGDLP